MDNRFIGELGTDAYGITANKMNVAHLGYTAAQAAALDADGILNDQASSTTAATVVTTFLAQPPCCRGLTITPSATMTAGNLIIEGTDYAGLAQSETIALTASDQAVSSVKAFKTITKITVPIQASAQTFDIGWDDRLGLPFCFSEKPLVFALFGGALETTAPTVAIDSDEYQKNTIDLNTALTGATGKTVDLFIFI